MPVQVRPPAPKSNIFALEPEHSRSKSRGEHDYDRGEGFQLVGFVLRCTAAAMLAYFLASDLTHPLWACIFVLIASQGQSAATFAALGGHVVGTLIGVVVAIAVGIAMGRIGVAAQTAVAVVICAAFAWERPAIQLRMWTPPIVLMSVGPSESVMSVGFYRSCEVILGGLVGGLLLIGAE